jgi:CDP-glucose 4,6-dehydratase
MNYTATFQNTYRGKKVFLTGHTGFKGSWLVTWLHQLGATVKGYALSPDHDNGLFRLINGEQLCDSVIADIRDKEKLTAEILSFKPDFIFHLAAQPLVRRSYEQPLYTFEVNVAGTANLLDAARQLNNNCAVVVITTDKVYENKEQHYAYKEDDKLGGYDPYSASKAAAEIVVGSYRDSFFKYKTNPSVPLASARAGNVIGGGDRSKDRIIPDIIRGLESNESILVRNPAAVRPWQHVLEPLGGYLLLGHQLKKNPVEFAEPWNIGPETEDILTVKQVVDKAIATYGKGKYHTPQLSNQPHEATLLQLDISKAKQKLNWTPVLNSSQAIQWTMEWYKEVMNGANPLELTISQVNQYCRL